MKICSHLNQRVKGPVVGGWCTCVWMDCSPLGSLQPQNKWLLFLVGRACTVFSTPSVTFCYEACVLVSSNLTVRPLTAGTQRLHSSSISFQFTALKILSKFKIILEMLSPEKQPVFSETGCIFLGLQKLTLN